MLRRVVSEFSDYVSAFDQAETVTVVNSQTTVDFRDEEILRNRNWSLWVI
jgi:hypothetical protein